MINSKKIFSVFLFSLILFLLLTNFSLAQRELEVEYPKIPGVEAPVTAKTPLPEYVRYIFNFTIMIGGIIALAMLIFGGVRYLLAAGNPEVINDAKDRIFSALLGLVILLSSYLILTTVNPQLIIIQIGEPKKIPPPEEYGVLLCKDAQGKECAGPYLGDVPDLKEFNRKAKYVKFKHGPGEIVYGIVAHKDRGYEGLCQVMKNDGVLGVSPSSINVFWLAKEVKGEGVTFYECPGYLTEEEEKCCRHWGPFGTTREGNFVKKLDRKGKGTIYGWKSLKIDGNYMAVLFEKKDFRGVCEVFEEAVFDSKKLY